MTELEAVETLRGSELVSVAQGTMDYIKELQDKCLHAGIPALAARPEDACGTKSCGTRLSLMIREADVPGVATLLQRDWAEMVAREGTGAALAAPAPGAAAETDGDLPCPACGVAAPLADGACSDCGLQLE